MVDTGPLPGRVVILAATKYEASEIARLVGLRPVQWAYFSEGEPLLGTWGAPVLVTSQDCWRRDRLLAEVFEIGQTLCTHAPRVTLVPCPPDWGQPGWALPAHWNMPAGFVPPEPRRSRWDRWMR